MARRKPRGEDITKKNAQPKGAQFEFLAPDACEALIAGDFNNWDERVNPMKKTRVGYGKSLYP